MPCCRTTVPHCWAPSSETAVSWMQGAGVLCGPYGSQLHTAVVMPHSGGY